MRGFRRSTSLPPTAAEAMRRIIIDRARRAARVKHGGDQVRITAQLIETDEGFHLWSETYDRTLDDIFAIQTEIAEAIAEELKVSLGLTDASALVAVTGDLTAYDLYLQGRARMRERGPGVAEAIELFEAAEVRFDESLAPEAAAETPIATTAQGRVGHTRAMAGVGGRRAEGAGQGRK